jgi:hypothetical protein
MEPFNYSITFRALDNPIYCVFLSVPVGLDPLGGLVVGRVTLAKDPQSQARHAMECGGPEHNHPL